jgi:predicted chitinase
MSTTKPPHQPAPKNAPAHPAPAPAQQPPAYVPTKWSYPFAVGDGKDASDAHSFFEALSNAEDGFYPLGANGIWHGGIHFDGATGKILKQDDGVRAIADGEVVAYRLDSKYPVLKYQDGKSCMYSTGFVLVRHKLVMPPAPVNGSDSAGGAGASEDKLTFFSLYMHLLDWSGFKAAIDTPPAVSDPSKASSQPVVSPIKCMPYWKGEKRLRVSASAADTQREQTPFNFPIPDPLRSDPPNGSPLQPGGLPGSLNPSGGPLSWPGPLTPSLDPNSAGPFRVDQPPLTPPATKQPLAKGAQVYSKVNGEAIGLLPQGTEVQLGPVSGKDKGWAPITKVIKGNPVGVVVGDPVDPRIATGWVKVDQFDLLVDPNPLDSVVVLETPYPVAAGTVIGFLGEYQRYREASKLPPTPQRSMLHLEVFAGADLPAFIKKSQARAKQLPDQSAFLQIAEGATLVDVAEATETIKTGLLLKPLSRDAGDGLWAKVQPTRVTMPPPANNDHSHEHPKTPKAKPIETSEGAPVWVERGFAGKTTTVELKAWRDFPLQVSNAKAPPAAFDEVYSRGELNKLGAEAKAQDDKQVNWWKVTVGTADGKSREGWICATDALHAKWHSAWEWPGFQLIDNTSVSLVDSFKRHLYVYEMLFDGDEDEFKPNALSVNGSELITKLEKVVDRLGNNDGKVSGQELARAQRVRWAAQAMSHFAVRYESEWGGDLSKWQSMSSLMKERKYIWQAELERIEKLRWWDKVHGVAGLPADPAVYHFHPVGLISNFLQKQCSCNKDLTEEELDSILPNDVRSKGLFHSAQDVSVRGYDKRKFLDLLNRFMRENEMLTCARKAHFLSQMTHECDCLRTNEEYRNRDGSIPSGWSNYSGGSNYHGRGLIQLTHDSNYARYGKYVGNDRIASDPGIVSHEVEHTVHSACWYWRFGGAWGDINPKADKNDFYAVTVAVNGGFNHIGERFVALNRLARLLGAEKCETTPGLIFSEYQFDQSALSGSKFSKTHTHAIEVAVDEINKSKKEI